MYVDTNYSTFEVPRRNAAHTSVDDVEVIKKKMFFG